MSGAAAIACACCDLIDWIEINDMCPGEGTVSYYITLEECAALGEHGCDYIDRPILTHGGRCYQSGSVHYSSVPDVEHFPGELGECARPGCYDVIVKWVVDMPWVEGECYSECDVEGGDCTGIAPGDVYRRYPGDEFPYAFEGLGEVGCDYETRPYWEGKIGIICPPTLDPENCEGSICTTGIDPGWYPVRIPRGCLFAGVVDIICKNAPDPPEVACCAAFDPDEFVWYDTDDFDPENPAYANYCCYENDGGVWPCICDVL